MTNKKQIMISSAKKCEELIAIARIFKSFGYGITATKGTGNFIYEHSGLEGLEKIDVRFLPDLENFTNPGILTTQNMSYDIVFMNLTEPKMIASVYGSDTDDLIRKGDLLRAQLLISALLARRLTIHDMDHVPEILRTHQENRFFGKGPAVGNFRKEMSSNTSAYLSRFFAALASFDLCQIKKRSQL